MNAIHTLEGYYALHDFRTIDWRVWNALAHNERATYLERLEQFLRTHETRDEQCLGNFSFYEIVGQKADFMQLHMDTSLQALAQYERNFNQADPLQLFKAAYSYFSIVELSTYTSGDEKVDAEHPMIKKRLFPRTPAYSHVCFYPMNKKRDGNDNWYMLPLEQRQSMMHAHGLIGRSYKDHIQQIVTGSIGLDDWEWGVTLYSNDPLWFKKIVYEMRFDEVSARFAEFGDFYVGRRMNRPELFSWFST